VLRRISKTLINQPPATAGIAIFPAPADLFCNLTANRKSVSKPARFLQFSSARAEIPGPGRRSWSIPSQRADKMIIFVV
jgi:hypothetical protein